MPRIFGWLLLVLCVAQLTPGVARAAGAIGIGSGDEERKDEPAPQAASVKEPSRVGMPVRAEPTRTTSTDFVPATQSITLDLGGGVNLAGGWNKAKIGLKGSPNNGFYANGLGGAFKLHWDFAASDLDWRLGLDGTLPGYMGLEATVGIRQNLSPWTNPRLLARVGGGLEMTLAGGERDTAYLVPFLVAKGELALEVTVIENLLAFGAGFELGGRYGVPLAVGFDFGAFVRTEIWF